MNGINPFKLASILWPHVTFYREQRLIIQSVWEDDETVVPAGNMLGKDFVAAFICLAFFLTRFPCRVVTTSAKDDHLRVLWGEIGRFITSAKHPLTVDKGGPLIVNHHEIRRVINGEKDNISYLVGMVASPDKIAAMQGHHANPSGVAEANDGMPRTLFVSDESSSVPDAYYTMASTWAHRKLIIGNTWPCENFFKRAVKGRPGTQDKGGNLPRPNGKGHYRRVIRIKAEDSPNVRLGLAQAARGIEPTNEVLVPGVKGYAEYVKNRKLWDTMQQCVSLDADWWEGADEKMFPSDWLDLSALVASRMGVRREGGGKRTMGVDSAMGGDNTSWCIGDGRGMLELISMKTPDTSIIVPRTIELMHTWDVLPGNVLFDAGGGGKPHADRMRQMGHEVRIVAFGAAPVEQVHTRRMRSSIERREDYETKVVYKNRRAQMYGELRDALNPSLVLEGDSIYSLPGFLMDKPRGDGGPGLRAQLAPMPLLYNGEGQLYLPPKKRKPGLKTTNELCLEDILGCSPDEADALVLMHFGQISESHSFVVGRSGMR
jgi:hypothetical protein